MNLIQQISRLGVAALWATSVFSVQAEAAAIAGLAPDQRPAHAPSIKAAAGPGPEATRGIEPPLPKSLGFLAHQGAWYTPFTLPGMTGHYDMRRWHAAPTDPRYKRLSLPQGK